jgi:hypothetical protein
MRWVKQLARIGEMRNVRSEVLKAVRIIIMLFWCLTRVEALISPEDGDSMFLRNDGVYL